MDFIDSNPDIETLTLYMNNSEEKAFNLGYIASLQGVLSDLHDTKLEIINTLMDGPENEIHKMQLETRLKILDLFESCYMRRIQRLSVE